MMKREELLAEIERLRAELEQKSKLSNLTASEPLEISRGLDELINRYLKSRFDEKKHSRKHTEQKD